MAYMAGVAADELIFDVSPTSGFKSPLNPGEALHV
jgi:hypothetical protein